MLPERPLEAVVGHQRILIIILFLWYHLMVTSRLSTTTASAIRTHESRSLQPAQLTMGCFNVPYRNQLGGSRDPRLGQSEEDGYQQPPLGQLNHRPNTRLVWHVEFSHLWVNTATGDSGTCLPAQPALRQGLQLELKEWSKQRHLGHVPEHGGQCFLTWQANNLRASSAFVLSSLGEEDRSAFK